MMIVFKGAFLASGAALALEAGDIVETGITLGNLNSAQILGIVAVASILGMVIVFTLKERASRKHYNERDHYHKEHVRLIEKTVAAIERNNTLSAERLAMDVELKDAQTENKHAFDMLCAKLERK